MAWGLLAWLSRWMVGSDLKCAGSEGEDKNPVLDKFSVRGQ